MNDSFFIKTYGCQMNVYDSEKISDIMRSQGYSQSESVENSDVAIFNTCHIREKASEKLFSDLGRIAIYKDNRMKAGRSMKVVVTGCVAQAEGEEIKKRSKAVDLILGPQNYQSLATALKKTSTEKIYTDFLCDDKFDSLPPSSTPEVSKLITVQEGCDKFCSFCVVPYTRGSEYSRNVENIFQEAQHLVSQGAKELTLLGQNVSSFKSNIFEKGKNVDVGLANLCRIISKLDGLERIRYLTSHPKDIDDLLINEHLENQKLMPFLHLPVQSGSDKILKKMNRNHSQKDYIELIKQIRSKIKNIAFSSDFIVGYPGESDKNFDETLELIEKVNFASSYSFKYSPRPGTQSSIKHTDIVDEKVSSLRLNKIQSVLNKQQKEFNESFLSKNVKVLFTSLGKKKDQYVGRTPHLQPVHVTSNKNIVGRTFDVKLENLTSFSFHGKILN